MKYCLLIVLLFTCGLTIKSMEVPSDFKRLPDEMKLSIANQFLDQRNLNDVMNSLQALSLVDKEFSAIITHEPTFKVFFELQKIKDPNTAVKYIIEHPGLMKYNAALYLHKKFPMITVLDFNIKLLDKINNPIKALRFVYDNPILRSIAWAEYLHRKFPYLTVSNFQIGISYFNEQSAEPMRKFISSQFAKLISNGDRELPRIFYGLIAGVNPNTTIKTDDDYVGTPLEIAKQKKFEKLSQLLSEINT